MDQRSRASADSDVSLLEHFESRDRRVAQPSQFMRISLAADVLFAAVLRDGACDGIVEAAVQRAKVLRTDGYFQFNGQISDGLTDVAIVVHHLSNSEPLEQQIVAVPDGAPGDGMTFRGASPQLLDQLVQEQGDALIDLRFGGRRTRSARDFRSTALNDLVAIFGNEYFQRDISHFSIVNRGGPIRCSKQNRSRDASVCRVQERGELFRRHWPAEIVPLRLITLVSPEERHFCPGFHAFGHDPQIQTPAHADDSVHETGLVGRTCNLTHERWVDLERVDREPSEVAQTGISRPEVIDRQPDALRFERLEDGFG